jgi:hypothetical protein
MQTLRVGDYVRFKLAWFEPVWVNARVVSVENPRESYVRVSFGRLGKTRGLDGLCHAWEKMRVAPPRCLFCDRVDVFVPCGVKHRWIGARVIPRSDAAWDEADGDVRVRISNRIDVNVSMINVAPSGHFGHEVTGRGSHEVPLNMPENAGESYWEKMKKMKMQVQVFRICTYPNKSNAFGIGDREENWILRRDDVVFTNEEDAKEYVRDKSRALTILPNLLISLPHAARPAFVDEFCFGDGYWADRRFFLGPPPVDKIIIDALKCLSRLERLHQRVFAW